MKDIICSPTYGRVINGCLYQIPNCFHDTVNINGKLRPRSTANYSHEFALEHGFKKIIVDNSVNGYVEDHINGIIRTDKSIEMLHEDPAFLLIDSYLQTKNKIYLIFSDAFESTKIRWIGYDKYLKFIPYYDLIIDTLRNGEDENWEVLSKEFFIPITPDDNGKYVPVQNYPHDMTYRVCDLINTMEPNKASQIALSYSIICDIRTTASFEFCGDRFLDGKLIYEFTLLDSFLSKVLWIINQLCSSNKQDISSFDKLAPQKKIYDGPDSVYSIIGKPIDASVKERFAECKMIRNCFVHNYGFVNQRRIDEINEFPSLVSKYGLGTKIDLTYDLFGQFHSSNFDLLKRVFLDVKEYLSCSADSSIVNYDWFVNTWV